jgi:hypothetical protein
MSVLNSDHIERILADVDAMQEEKVIADSNEEEKKGSNGIISRVREFIKGGNTLGER